MYSIRFIWFYNVTLPCRMHKHCVLHHHFHFLSFFPFAVEMGMFPWVVEIENIIFRFSIMYLMGWKIFIGLNIIIIFCLESKFLSKISFYSIFFCCSNVVPKSHLPIPFFPSSSPNQPIPQSTNESHSDEKSFFILMVEVYR